MPPFLRIAAAVALGVAMVSAVPDARAEDGLATPALKKPKTAKAAATTSIPAKGDRRPGELEGWDSGVKGPVKRATNRPADAIGEKRSPDGGLPLPDGKLSGGAGDAPIGFDSKGNMGGMFKF